MLLNPQSTLFFLCDVQTKFRPAIHGYEHVVATANKMVKLAKLLEIEVVCTTQNTKDPEIDLDSLGPLLLGTFDKTLFSMLTDHVKKILDVKPHVKSIVIFGIETHVCVLQTVLSILETAAQVKVEYKVHVVADGVSSCNSFEVPVALERMRSEGAVIGTSESIAFQLMADAGSPNFKAFSKFIKEVKESTKTAGEALLQGKTSSASSADAAKDAEAEVASGGIIVGLKSSM